MTSLTECRLFHPTLTFNDISKKPQYKNIKFKRAFQFLQLLLLQRVYGIDVIIRSSIRRLSKQKKCQFEVFLGGSCNPTTWRYEQAIPYFQSRSISYYNPQVANWTPDLIEIEHHAKELASLLFFVIDHNTRSLAAIAEVCYLSACKRNIIIVINSMPDDKNQIKFIQQKNSFNEKDDEYDYENACEARRTLRILLQSINIPVFDNIRVALECATFILESTKETIKNEDNHEKIIRSFSNKITCETPKDLSRRRHSATLITNTNRSLSSLSPFLRSINFPNSLYFHRISNQISNSTNENDDDGYGSLISSNRTLSQSSSSIASDFCEYSIDENNSSEFYLSILNNIISIFISSILFINPPLITLFPIYFIKNIFLPSIPTIEEIIHFDSSLFDLYIASGDYDEYWLNTFALPLLDKVNVKYIKRQIYHENEQLDILYDIHIRKQSRLLYYLINNNERLSYLVTELAFLIGEHKYNIIVYLQSTINENSDKILTKNERQDIERSRKYLEDLAKKENILLCQSREQSWQHVLAFFLQI